MKHLALSLFVVLGLGAATTYGLSGMQPSKGTPFIGAEIGVGGIDTPKLDNMTSKIQQGIAYSLHGGYLFNLSNQFQIGPELAYTQYPDNKYTKPSVFYQFSGSYISLLAQANYTFNSNWTLIGKIGLANITQTFSRTGNSVKKTNTLPELVLGGGYNFSRTMGIYLSYNAVFGKNKTQEDIVNPKSLDKEKEIAPVKTIMLGFNYYFA